MFRLRLTLEGWYYLVVMGFLLSGSLLREMNLMLLIVGLMTGPLLASFVLAGRALRRVTVWRRAPAWIHAGDALAIEYLAKNARRTTCWALVVRDRIRRDARGEDAVPLRVVFSRLVGKSTQSAVCEGQLARRGRYLLGPLELSTRFPLGLVQKTVHWEQPAALIVYPKLGKLSPAWRRMWQEREFGSRPLHARAGLLEAEVHALREYLPGDSQRLVHWRTSARKGELMVKQFEQQRQRDLAVLVELWLREDSSEAQQAVELAVSFAATLLAEHAREGGGRLTLGIAGRELRVLRGQSSAGLLREAWEALAVAEPATEDRLPDLFAQGLSPSQRRAALLVISTRMVDLRDDRRFAALRGNPLLDVWMARGICVNTQDARLREWFQFA